MKLIPGYSYIVKSKEEAQEIIDKLEKLGVRSLGGNKWAQTFNVLELSSLGNEVNFYTSVLGTVCNTFEEWCERSIEGYKRSTEKTWDQSKSTLITGLSKHSKEIQERLFELGYQWVTSGKKIQSYPSFTIKTDKKLYNLSEGKKHFTENEFVQILRNMTPVDEKKEVTETGYKVEQTSLGTKYTVPVGCKDFPPISIGQRVHVESGININSEKTITGRVTLLDTSMNEVLVREDKGGLLELYAYPNGLHKNEPLVITVLNDQTEEGVSSKPLATTKQDEYWNGKRIVTKDNAYVGMKVVRGRDWEWKEQDNGSLYGEIVKTMDFGGFSFQVDWKDKNGKVIKSGSWYRGKNSFDLCEYQESVSEIWNYPPFDTSIMERVIDKLPQSSHTELFGRTYQYPVTPTESVKTKPKRRVNLSLLSEGSKIEIKTSERKNKNKLNLKLI